ncbi:MAG: ATP-dependent Clp protease proteolytic subunit [Ruminiclostridium sp.]|nr:ATP-dependent Clp protease proteolytic subunit [Ruminiclostridium sp.]
MIPCVLKESSRGYQSVPVEEMFFRDRTIFLTEEINTETCAGLIKQLLFLENEEPGKEIKLYINSPGGHVHSGLAVYDCMRLISSPITTICMGTAASMGSILFLGGTKRQMLPNSRIMIHDPSFGGGNLAGMKPHQIKTELDDLVEVQDKLCSIIAERTGKTPEDIRELTKDDTYFNAEEAVAFGLATETIDKIN